VPKKVDNLQILADVLNAMFGGERVAVETTRVKITKTDDGKSYTSFENTPQILTPQGTRKNTRNISENVYGAKSIKVGRDITIKRNSKNFIVRTMDGELILPNNTNSDINYIWTALGTIYDNGQKDIMRVAGNLARQLPTKELRAMAKNVAQYGMVLKPKKDIYRAAIDNLQEMGIEPKRIMEYIKKQSKEND
jgi:hypothetical protein